jgi:hypothetical protein
MRTNKIEIDNNNKYPTCIAPCNLPGKPPRKSNILFGSIS